jgi:hypothetical protein
VKNILIYPDRRTFKILPESKIQPAIEERCLNNPHHNVEDVFSVTPFMTDPGEGICGELRIIIV